MKQPKKVPVSPPKPRPQQAETGWISRHRLLLILLLCIAVVFANSLRNKYALDDEFYTNHGNKLTDQGLRAIPKIFTSRTFSSTDGEGYSFRPVSVTSFAIEHQFFKANPHVSHAISLLLYLLTALVLFHLLKKWFAGYSEWFVFFVCLLYFLHPLHTEVVDNIKSRDELLAMLGALLSLWFAWRFYETGKWHFALLYPLFFWLGFLSKHTVIPYVLLFPLVLYFFATLNWKKIAAYTVPLVLTMIATVLYQKFYLPLSTRRLIMLENPIVETKLGFIERTATAAHVLGRYLMLHTLPHPLVYYYGYGYVPIAHWTDVLPVLSVIVYGALFVIAVQHLRSKSLLSFGILFYLISIAAYSNLLEPAPGMMAERFTYTPSLGFCIAACAALFMLFKADAKTFNWQNSDCKKIGYILITVAIAYGVRDIIRNTNWKNKTVLYTHDMPYLEESTKGNMMYGNLVLSKAQADRITISRMMNSGNQYRDSVRLLYASFNAGVADAQTHFKKATEITPTYSIAWINLATTYYFQNKFSEALMYSKKGIQYDPRSVEGTYNTGMAFNSLKNTDSARYYFQRTLELDSTHIQSYERLSNLKWQEQDTAAALNILNKAVILNPASDNACALLSQLYLKCGDQLNALKYTELAAEINPKNIQRLQNLQGYYQMNGNAAKASYYQNKITEQHKP
ncbi:MAG: hypothetical protein U0T74_12520 [Chitinophagales bacterium]